MSSDSIVESESKEQSDAPRRSTKERRQPDNYGREQTNLAETPSTFKDASTSKDKVEWKVAMETEMNSLQENDATWTESSRNLVGLERYKAHSELKPFAL